MMTDLEKLKAFMETRGLDAVTLAEKMRVSYSTINKVLSRKRAFSNSLRIRFARAFGLNLMLETFDVEFGQIRRTNGDNIVAPERYAANKAVANAMRRGEMQPAKNYICAGGCGKQAKEWHHPSYHPDSHLCVVPLCKSCHNRADRGTLDATFGVVPMRCGLVRIAISHHPS